MVDRILVGSGADVVVQNRMSQAYRLVRMLLRHHKRTFFTAVGGAAVFASCTVASAVMMRRIVDDVAPPANMSGCSARMLGLVEQALAAKDASATQSSES